MRKTTSGFRAHAFESIEAPDKGSYLDKTLYVVEGLPGVWRRVKLPKGDPAAVGLLQCWFIDGPVALEYSAAASDEFAEGCVATGSGSGGSCCNGEGMQLVQELRDKRTEHLIAEKNKADGAPVASTTAPSQPSADNVPGASPSSAAASGVEL